MQKMTTGGRERGKDVSASFLKVTKFESLVSDRAVKHEPQAGRVFFILSFQRLPVLHILSSKQHADPALLPDFRC